MIQYTLYLALNSPVFVCLWSLLPFVNVIHQSIKISILSLWIIKFLTMGQHRALFIYVLFTSKSQIETSADAVLGIQTQGRRVVGTDGSTELCFVFVFVFSIQLTVNKCSI